MSLSRSIGKGVTMARRYPFALVFIAACGLYLVTASGYIIVSDAGSMLGVTQSLLHGHLDVPCDPSSARGLAGHCYSFYGLGWSLAAIPFYLLGSLVGAHVHLGGAYEPTVFAVSFINAFLVAGIVAMLAKFVRLLSGSLRVAFVSAALFGVASPAWVYIKDGFSEPLSGLCLLTAAYVLTVETKPQARHGLIVGSLLSFAIVTRNDVLPIAIVIIAYALVQWGVRPRWLHGTLALPLAAFGLVQFAYDYARFGSIFSTGYEHLGSGTSFHRSLSGTLDGLLQLLVNPTQGLVWFVPTLIVTLIVFPAFLVNARRIALLCVGVFLAAWVMHANLFNTWQDGFTWGPRYLLPALPFLFVSLAGLRWTSSPTLAKAALVITGTAGFVENSIAIFVRFERFYYADAAGLSPGPWPQVYLWRAAVQVLTNVLTGHIPVGRLSELRGSGPAVVARATVLNEPDFWWFHLLRAHTLTVYVIVALAGLLTLFIVSAWLLARVWRTSDRLADNSVANQSRATMTALVASPQ
jgi:hypothetical protein